MYEGKAAGPTLERNIIVAFLRSRFVIRSCIMCGFPLASGGSLAGHKLKVLNCNPVPAALRAVLSSPRIERQSALDKDKSAFAEILIQVLRLSAERPAIDKTCIFPLAAVLARPPTIRSQTEIDHRGLVRRVRQLGIAGKITHQ